MRASHPVIDEEAQDSVFFSHVLPQRHQEMLTLAAECRHKVSMIPEQKDCESYQSSQDEARAACDRFRDLMLTLIDCWDAEGRWLDVKLRLSLSEYDRRELYRLTNY